MSLFITVTIEPNLQMYNTVKDEAGKITKN